MRPLTLVIIIFSFLFLYFVATFNGIGAILKFLLVIVELIVAGHILRKTVKASNNWWVDGEYGLILLKTKNGLKYITHIAKNKVLWNFLADVGLVMGYGVFSLFLMKKHLDWKKFIIGMLLLIFISMFVSPISFPFLISQLKGGQVVQQSTIASSNFGLSQIIMWVGLAVNYLFGFFGIILFGVVKAGIVIINQLINGHSEQTVPGATLILPGINIPFVEGILALLLILVIHEGSHAVLGKVAKIPLLSTGLVLLGVVPIGAFVEPDEKKLEKLDDKRQTRVLIAGPASNFYASIILFVLFFSLISLTSNMQNMNMVVVNGLGNTTNSTVNQTIVVYSINEVNFKTSNSFNLTPGDTATLQTNIGEVDKVVNDDGKVGVEGYLVNNLSGKTYDNWFLNFLYVFLGLATSLNLVIGIVNLLPIPAFDGYRLLELNIKNKKVMDALMYLSILALLLNFLPWIF